MVDSVAVFPPGLRVLNASGDIITSGTVEFYVANSDTSKAVYSDSDLTSSLGTIIYLDSGGYPVSASGSSTKVAVYTDTDPYKIIIKENGVTAITHASLRGAVISGGSGGSSGITQDQADVRYIRNPDALASDTNIDAADLVPFRDTSESANNGILYSDLVIDIFATAAATGYSSFASGTRLVFDQAAAPTGWTKQTTYDDAAIRIVSGSSGGTTVGTTGFTTRFAATGNTPAGTVGGTTLTEANLAIHNHTLAINRLVNNGELGTSRDTVNNGNTNTGNIGSNSTHTHSFTGSALDLTVKYRDMIVATKN